MLFPSEFRVDLDIELFAEADAFLVGRIAAELEGRREAIALYCPASEEVGDLDGAFEQVPGGAPLALHQAHGLRQHGAEIDHAQSVSVAELLQFVPLRVNLEQIIPSHALELNAVEPERLHFAENSKCLIERRGVSVFRNGIKPAATDLHSGSSSGGNTL